MYTKCEIKIAQNLVTTLHGILKENGP